MKKKVIHHKEQGAIEPRATESQSCNEINTPVIYVLSSLHPGKMTHTILPSNKKKTQAKKNEPHAIDAHYIPLISITQNFPCELFGALGVYSQSTIERQFELNGSPLVFV